MSFSQDERDKLLQRSRERTLSSKPLYESTANTQRLEPKGSLMKTLDFITKPLYASAGFANAIVQGKGSEEAFKSAYRGLTGKERTFYSDVLASAGVKNKYVKAVAGFALDVALDPVTYLSFGTGAGARLGLTTLNKTGKTFLTRTLNKQMPKMIKMNLAKGMAEEVAEQLARETVETAVLKIALKEPQKYVAEKALKIFGKKIPVANDLYQMTGKKIAPYVEKFSRTKPMMWLGESFIGEKYIIKHAKDLSKVQKNILELSRQQTKTKILRGSALAMEKSIQMAEQVPNIKDRELIANAIELLRKRKVPVKDFPKGLKSLVRKVRKYNTVEDAIAGLGDKYIMKKFGGKGGVKISGQKELLNADIAVLSEVIKNHPAASLHKYAIKGELPEVTGKGVSLFAKKGDDLVRTLGFADSETARSSYDDFLKLKEKMKELYANKKGLVDKSAIEGGISIESANEFRQFYEKATGKVKKDNLATLLPEHLVEKAREVDQTIFKEITNPEAQRGLITGFKNGYIPHYYKKRLQGFFGVDVPHPIVARNKNGQVRIFETMSEAVDKGWQPIEDYTVSVGLRNSYSKTILAIDDYVQNMLSNVGIPVFKNTDEWKTMLANKRVPEGMGLYIPRGGARFSPLQHSTKSKATQVKVAGAMEELFKREGTGGFFGGELLKDLRLTPVQAAFKVSDDIPVYLLPKDIADMMNKASPYLTREKSIKGFLALSDSVMNVWKTSVTTIWPGFHSRNAMSNVWLAYLGGLKNPMRYKDATEIQRYSYLIDKGKKVDDFIVKLNGKSYKASQLVKQGRETGVLNRGWFGAEIGGSFEEEIARKLGTKKSLTAKEKLLGLPRAGIEKSRRVGTAVENNARFALFLDQIDKGFDINSASAHTKKFLFDYGELTQFEKKVMKRVVPFYTWLRKNVPLEIEQMMQQPGKFAQINKVKEEIESLSPEPNEEFLPDWVREKELFVRTPWESKDKPIYLNFDFAFNDLAKLNFTGKPLSTLREWVSTMRPDVKALIEMASNYNIFYGREMVDSSLPEMVKLKEMVKQELLNNMRITGYWRKLNKDDTPKVLKILDMALGLSSYTYNEQSQKRWNRIDAEKERNALKKYNRSKEKKK